MTRDDVMKEFEDSVAFSSRQRMADEIVALRAEKRNNVACVKWIAAAFCDAHGNPRGDMPSWAHMVTDTLLLGLTPDDNALRSLAHSLSPRVREAMARALDVLTWQLEARSRCGDPDTECPLQDACKPSHDHMLAVEALRSALADADAGGVSV
jgi:hypothetical protein